MQKKHIVATSSTSSSTVRAGRAVGAASDVDAGAEAVHHVSTSSISSGTVGAALAVTAAGVPDDVTAGDATAGAVGCQQE